MRWFHWLTADRDDAFARQYQTDPGPTGLDPAARPVILVAEDEPRIRRLLVDMLAPDEPILLEASHGEEAVAVVDRHPDPIDLLVTDIDMPVMDGQTLAGLLHRRCPNLKVLFVSGVAPTLFETRDVLPPWAAYLDKPVTPTSLRQAASLMLYGTISGFGSWRQPPAAADA